MNEFDLIAKILPTLAGNPSVVVPAGDDCAVIDLGLPGQSILFKTDAVVEGIHFTRESPPEKVGHKAIARCLSDIAAMGGSPNSALVTLALPREYDVAWVEAFYHGLNATARRFGVAIAGGETTTNPDRILVSIALLGLVRSDRCLLRSGAKVGDAICVTGELGGSIEGRHLEFEPRIREARWLAENFQIHSMMDISDGLAGDLRHMLKASKTGAELLASAIPSSRIARLRARFKSGARPALVAALADGEDFELLFTVAASQMVPLLDAWKKEFPDLHLSCIGRITEEPGLRIKDKHGVRNIEQHGYTHFQ